MSRAKKLSMHDSPPHNFIAGAIKHPGALHEQLHVPKGKKIPVKKLNKATHSKNLLLKRRALFAKTLSKLPRHHGSR